MQKLKLLAASAVLALGLEGLLATPAAAHPHPHSVILDDGTPYTVGGAFGDGQSVSVLPSTAIEVKFEVEGHDGHNWQSTKWDIGGGLSDGCDNFTPNHDGASFALVTETFNIMAPAAPGVYNLVLGTRSNNSCGGQQANVTLVGAVTVLGETAFNDIEKALEAGPYDDDGDPILFVPIFGLGEEPVPDSTAPDDGVIGIGLDFDQHYWFSMTLTDVFDGTVVYDVIPAEYNLDDPDIHDITDLGDNGATCNNPGDGTVDCTADDGICHDRNGDDVDCSNVVVTGDCTATLRQPAGSKSDETARFKEPELLTTIVGTGGGGDFSCTVDVFVVTDGNPGHWVEDGPPPVFTLYEPTSCLAFRDDGDVLLGDTDNGDPIVDSIALNDGFKDFDPVTGDRISGPRGSLQLTPIGCDSDDDGVIDELDMCPIEEGEGDRVDGCLL